MSFPFPFLLVIVAAVTAAINLGLQAPTLPRVVEPARTSIATPAAPTPFPKSFSKLPHFRPHPQLDWVKPPSIISGPGLGLGSRDFGS